jgi:5-methylcytosine-specific restriction endonuclease McrBC regulatory subunit McrC
MQIIQMTERKWRTLKLPPAIAGELLPTLPPRIESFWDANLKRYSICSHGLIGELRLKNVCLQIRPKISRAHLAYLLGFDRKVEEFSASDQPFWTELLAIRFCDLLEARHREGFHQEYVELTDQQKFIRGRLDLSQASRQPNPTEFRCETSELTLDHAWHQFLQEAVVRLTRIPLASPVRDRVRAAQSWFAGVSKLSRENLSRLRRESPPLGYGPLIELAKLIWSTINTVGQELFDLEMLFEQFLQRNLSRDLPDCSVVREPTLEAEPVRSGKPLKFFPDVVIRRGDESLLVLDAKWKRFYHEPFPEDLHQVIAYGAMTNAREVRLIFPGKRFASWEYRLPKSKMKLRVQRLNIASSFEEMERDWKRFVKSVIGK